MSKMTNREHKSVTLPEELLVSLALLQESWEVLNVPNSVRNSEAESYFNFLGLAVQATFRENPQFLSYLLDLSGYQHKNHVLLGEALEEITGIKVAPSEGKGSGILIASTGRIASGKGTFSKILESDYQFHPLEMSNVAVIMAALSQGNKLPDRSQIGAVARELKKTFGPTILLRTLLRTLFLNQGDYSRFMIDGVRNEPVAKSIKQLPGDVTQNAALVGIHTGKSGEADLHERYSRSKFRGNTKDGVDFDEFIALDTKEKQGISDAWQYVDHEIVNDDEDHFLNQIETLMLMYGIDYLSE